MDHRQRAHPPATRAGPRERDAGHDRRLEGAGRRSADDQPCVFHRNLEISSRYAWIYTFLPAYLKWAGWPRSPRTTSGSRSFPPARQRPHRLRGHPAQPGRRKVLLIADVNTIRETNNAIFDDIFWVHLAYAAADDGIERLRALLRAEPHYAPVLAGFETIDQARRLLEAGTTSAEARRTAEDLIWKGNVQLLEHEQRALVQPNLDGLSCAFARLFSIGSALTFEVRGVRDDASYFTSFYLYSLTRGIPHGSRHRRGRESPASPTAGAGSSPASSHASGASTPTRACSTPACAVSSTKHATTRRTPASDRVHRNPRAASRTQPRAVRLGSARTVRSARIPKRGRAQRAGRHRVRDEVHHLTGGQLSVGLLAVARRVLVGESVEQRSRGRVVGTGDTNFGHSAADATGVPVISD